jgi:hypothetical protein
MELHIYSCFAKWFDKIASSLLVERLVELKNTSLVEWRCAKQDLNECKNTSRQNDYVALELKRRDNDGFSY